MPCILVLLISLSVGAQDFSLGVKAGGLVNWAAFGDRTQKDTFGTRPTFGYTAGFQIGFPMKENFRFLTEVGFTRKGRSLTFNGGEWQNKSVYHFAEANMLLRKSFRFEFADNVPADWFFSLGPEVAYWFSSRGKIIVDPPGTAYTAIFNTPPESVPNDPANPKMFYNNINRWLFSLVLGVGFKAPLKGNQSIATELRFVSGHTFLGGRNSTSMQILGFDDTLLTNLKSINLVATYTFDFNVQKSRKGKSTLNKKLKKSR